MIIKVEIGGRFIHRIYVDGGSASEILYEHCFKKLRLEIKNQMVSATTPLIGFSGEIIWPLGKISLLVKTRDEEHSTSAWMNFVIVRSSSPYNRIIGRPGIKKIHAVLLTTHGMLKFPITGGIITLRSSKIIPIECAAVSKTEGQPSVASQAVEEKIKIVIHPEHSEQTIMIGSTLTEECRNKLCDLLRRNLDVADRNQAIQEEVGKLIDAGIVKEVHYHNWLSNLVMVKKHDGSWRMCVDFKDLNKACPKYGYPLPEIDWKVESLYGFTFKCFLDTYKGYHQIKMAKEDEEKTAFTTSQGIFCYSKMPFGLRNAGATFQRLVGKAFHKQVGRNLEVEEELSKPWILFTDGSSCADGFGAGLRIGTNGCEKSPSKCGFTTGGQPGQWNLHSKGSRHDPIPGKAEADKARVVRRKSQRFAMINGFLYKKSFLRPWLRFVVAKALQIGYYWPTMHKDTRAIIWACKDCQANGLVERANRILGDGIKARLDARSKDWMEEISYNRVSHPDRNWHVTLRTTEVDLVINNEALEDSLDLLEENREQVVIRKEKSKRKMEKYYNSKVRNTSFKPGDLIYHSNDASHVKEGGKLGPKWEGPYEVTKALSRGHTS
ncbi:reverse transcriptase domain-containing protein [Tanacetum coccineum]